MFQVLDGLESVLRRILGPSPYAYGSQRRHFSDGNERNLQHSAHVRKGQSPVSFPSHRIRVCLARSQLAVRWFSGNCGNTGLTLPFYNHVLVSRLVHFSVAWNYQEGLPRGMAHVHNEKPIHGDVPQQQPWHYRQNHELVFSEFRVCGSSTGKSYLAERWGRRDSGIEIQVNSRALST